MRKNKYSDFKIAWYPDKLKSFEIGYITPPIYIRIKPTNRCNHNCWFCVYNPIFANMHAEMDRRDELSKEALLRTINDLGDMEVKAITFSGGGEPLCHPNIEDALRIAFDRGIRVSAITNGQLLNENRSKLLQNSDWVRVSVDYFDYKSFSTSRGGSEKAYNELLKNLHDFGTSNKISDFGINFIINKNNIDNLEESYKLFKNLGVDNIRFSPVWTSDLEGYHLSIRETAIKSIEHIKSIADIEIYDSYSNVFQGNKPRTYTKCFISQIVPVIAADGFIYSCHNMSYDKSGRISPDNLESKSIKDIWYSDNARNFFNTFNPSIQCTGQCSNDHKNINIYNLLKGYGDPFI